MVAEGGLPDTLRLMPGDMDFFLGPHASACIYEQPRQVAAVMIETDIALYLADPARTRQYVDFILGFNNSQALRIELLLRQLGAARWFQRTFAGD